MRKMWTKLFTTSALTFMLCLTGLVMSGEAQAQRFVDNGNGTVTDTQTNLMWTKNANPFGTRLTWDDAMTRCGSFSISGISGWRLPGVDELAVLYQGMKGGHPFTGFRSSDYWSSSLCADTADCVFSVCMFGGFTQPSIMTDTHNVWPVRASQ